MARGYGASLSEPKVHQVVSLGKHANDREAKQMLDNVAKQVQPIMRKRGWIVPLLSEFFPANANLLGLNIGGGGGRTREIKVRLRPATDPSSFLPYEDVLGTMLHELVHNVRGPHDSNFYKMLDELQTECEDLVARGISGTGSGFDGPSCGRLGSHGFIPQHNPPPHLLRDVALKAAEDRAKKQRLMACGPQRLGGAAVALDPRQAAARAAERRLRDNTWCPCEEIGQALEAVHLGRSGGAVGTRRAKQQAQQAQNAGTSQQPASCRVDGHTSASARCSSDAPGQPQPGGEACDTDDDEDVLVKVIEDDNSGVSWQAVGKGRSHGGGEARRGRKPQELAEGVETARQQLPSPFSPGQILAARAWLLQSTSQPVGTASGGHQCRHPVALRAAPGGSGIPGPSQLLAAPAARASNVAASSVPMVDLTGSDDEDGRDAQRALLAKGSLCPWACPRCTFRNAAPASVCGMCCALKAPDGGPPSYNRL